MVDGKLQGELQKLIDSLLKTTSLLFSTYESQLKIIGLFVLAWVSFKIGKKTVADPLQKQVKDMKKTLANRQIYTVALPAKIKQISRNLLIILVLAVIPAIAYLSQQYIYPNLAKKIDLNIIVIVQALLAIIMFLMWIYQLFLKFKLSRGRFNDHHMQQNLTAILKTLGGKSQSLLKHYLCNDSIGKMKSNPIGICSKQKCKQYRLLLKDKSDCITILVENVINFQWCSICKKRAPFDEFLSFKAAVYSKKQTKNQDEEVSDRNLYLLDQIQKMSKWVKELAPCNCSMRYWNESKKEIVLFKKREKDADQRLALFEARQNFKR